MQAMKFNQTPAFCAVGVALIGVVATGCGGINASKSISPLDFLLPGLHLRNDAPVPLAPGATNALAYTQPAIPSSESSTKCLL